MDAISPAANVAANIIHHGAVNGVTGSCHQLFCSPQHSILIDCGLFQGAETSPGGRHGGDLAIDFDISAVTALVATHVHIDHVGRIPHLVAAGFRGPIYCSQPSAKLLPLVLEDALKVGVTRDAELIETFLRYIHQQLRPLPYGQWQMVVEGELQIRLQRAGHILGSAYVECDVRDEHKARRRVVFSGDLGAAHTPLLYAPHPPSGCDELVIESTYGDRQHYNRQQRAQALQGVIEAALNDAGSVLIPAFSIGRTQELLYEIEGIIHKQRRRGDNTSPWHKLPVIVDSPLASRFTNVYRQLNQFWDDEAKSRVRAGRHPLSFDQLITVDDHDSHMRLVSRLVQTKQPAIIIAASGMCAGGRIMNYLKAMLEDPSHNILFVGYQARGTPGRDIQQYGPRQGYVDIDSERYTIRAGVETISGYSAHADQQDLLNFIRRMHKKPDTVRIVHGDDDAKNILKAAILNEGLARNVFVPA